MGIRRSFVVVLVSLLLAPAVARADRHFADVAAAGFAAKGSNYKGWQVSGSWPIPRAELSLVGTFGRYYGHEDDDPAHHTLATYIIGLRYTHHWKYCEKKDLLPFVQALGGAVDNVRELSGDLAQVRTHPIAILGLGIQPSISGNNKIRLRVQADAFYRWERELGPIEPGGIGGAVSLGVVVQFGPEFH